MSSEVHFGEGAQRRRWLPPPAPVALVAAVVALPLAVTARNDYGPPHHLCMRLALACASFAVVLSVVASLTARRRWQGCLGVAGALAVLAVCLVASLTYDVYVGPVP